jgi:hypothetical protein
MKISGKKPTDLIFPSKDRGPDRRLLRNVKAAAKRAGLADMAAKNGGMPLRNGCERIRLLATLTASL